jgi:hypothetical protein
MLFQEFLIEFEGPTKLNYFRQNLMKQRKRIAFSPQNPRMIRVTFHTFRYFYRAIECHRAKDILHVQQRRGHNSILNTIPCMQLVGFEGDDYHAKTARTLKKTGTRFLPALNM